MGFNTTVFFLNDGFDQIKKNPEEFVEKISRLMNYGGTFGVGNHVNCASVMKTEHADVLRLYVTVGNDITELSQWSSETRNMAQTDPEYLKRLLVRARHELDGMEKMMGDLGA